MIYVMSGGGGTGGTLAVSGVAGHTVTAKNGSKTYTRTLSSSGTATFKGLATGTWTLEMSGGGKTARSTVAITVDYSVTMKYFAATINVSFPADSTCSMSDGSTTLTAPDTSGTWSAVVPNAGTWTVECHTADGSKSKSATISITTDGQSSSVTLTYETYYYNKGDTCSALTGGWTKTGSGGSLTFNTASMTLKANSYQNRTDASTVNKVNLANIKTLYFSVKSATTYGTQGYPRIGVSSVNNPDPTSTTNWTVTKTLSASSSFGTVSLDVSSLTGSYYIVFGGCNGDSGAATIEVQSIWGKD